MSFFKKLKEKFVSTKDPMSKRKSEQLEQRQNKYRLGKSLNKV